MVWLLFDFIVWSEGGEVIAFEKAASASLKRWAIVCSTELEQTGVGDLLTAELSKRQDVELLEREQIQKAMVEWNLGRMLGAADGNARLKIGHILRADGLVIVGSESEGAPAVVRVAIADCLSGARLHVQELPAGTPLETAEKIGEMVGILLRRFPRGVQHIIGVSGFVSRNLVHDYDDCQTSYADILASALSVQPGTAVIAIEEARSISQELAGDNTALVKRVVPLIVEGEFRMKQAAGQAQPTVELAVRITDGTSSQEIRSGFLTLADAPAWIATALPKQMYPLVGKQKGLTVDEQIAAFVRQADEFSHIGAYAHSTKLREAALLLREDLVKERLCLIEEYHRLSRADGLSHLEYLIRTARIDAEQAIHLSRLLHHALDERFLMEVYPKVLSLPHSDSGAASPAWAKYNLLEAWSMPLWDAVMLRVRQADQTNNDLPLCVKILTTLLPDGIEMPYAIQGCLYGGLPPNKAEHITFIEALAQSQHRTASILGRCMLLRIEWLTKGKDPGAMRALLPDVNRLIEDYRNLPYAEGVQKRRDKDNGYIAVWTLQRDVIQAAQPALSPNAQGDDAISQNKSPALKPHQPPDRTIGAVRFTVIETIQLKRLDGRTEALPSRHWTGPGGYFPAEYITRCGPNLDVNWSRRPDAILFMRQPGILEEVFATGTVGFRHVVWDGANVWVATRYDGLWLLDADGKMAGKIAKEQGLPPVEDDIMLHPVAPGRVVAIGSFGKYGRAWCAVVEWSRSAGGKVNVFHEAKCVESPDGDAKTDEQRPDLVFRPIWLHAYRAKGDSPDPMLLVGRCAPVFPEWSLRGNVRRRPLLINLRSLEVSIFERDFGMFNRDSFYSQISLVNPSSVNSNTAWFDDPEELATLVRCSPHEQLVDGGDGYLYVAGMWWYRIDPKTMTGQRLTSFPMPEPFRWIDMFVTAHYGLMVRAEDGRFYRMSIDEQAIPKAGDPMGL